MAESKTGLNLQLPTDLYHTLKAICEYRKTSMTATVIGIIQSYLADNAPIVDALKKQRELFETAMKKAESVQKAQATRRKNISPSPTATNKQKNNVPSKSGKMTGEGA